MLFELLKKGVRKYDWDLNPSPSDTSRLSATATSCMLLPEMSFLALSNSINLFFTVQYAGLDSDLGNRRRRRRLSCELAVITIRNGDIWEFAWNLTTPGRTPRRECV